MVTYTKKKLRIKNRTSLKWKIDTYISYVRKRPYHKYKCEILLVHIRLSFFGVVQYFLKHVRHSYRTNNINNIVISWHLSIFDIYISITVKAFEHIIVGIHFFLQREISLETISRTQQIFFFNPINKKKIRRKWPISATYYICCYR